MTLALNSLQDVADDFDAIVLDQWGVLHDGSTPYPGAIDALQDLKARGTRLAVLSNSGKRAALNADRIATMGFDPALFDIVMTSGEALWRDISSGHVTHHSLYPIAATTADAERWADGLDLILSDELVNSDAVLLMGLPDGSTTAKYETLLQQAANLKLPILCTNPDRASPRAGGVTVISPGALAQAYADTGGSVRFYGKPHLPVFGAVEAALDLPAARLLMVGDSLEHDIAGGHAAGWSTAFIRNGLYASTFAECTDPLPALRRLARDQDKPMPTFTLAQLG